MAANSKVNTTVSEAINANTCREDGDKTDVGTKTGSGEVNPSTEVAIRGRPAVKRGRP